MKAATQVGMTVACVSLFLGLAVLGVSIKVETKPEAVNAACPDKQSIQCVGGVPYYFDACGNQQGVAPGACGTMVKIKVNGQSNGGPTTPVSITSNTVTVSWTSNGVGYCNTGTSYSPWGPYVHKATSGSQTVTLTSAQAQGFTFGIQCAVDANSNMLVQDNVSVKMATATPACSQNSDCPAGSFTGSLTCQNNDVYQNYRTYTCQNPGTQSASCVPSDTLKLKQMCAAAQGCDAGGCYPEAW